MAGTQRKPEFFMEPIVYHNTVGWFTQNAPRVILGATHSGTL
jgi:hypothetical protein